MCAACRQQLDNEPRLPWQEHTEWPNKRLEGNQVLGWLASAGIDEPTHKKLTSPCGKYVAAWFDRDPRQPELVIHQTGESTTTSHTLTRNTYRLDRNMFACHWFTHPTERNKTILLYNPSHGVLALVDPETGFTIAIQDDGMDDFFIIEVLTLSSRNRLLVCGWNFHPILAGKLFDVSDLLERKGRYKMTLVYDEQSDLHGKAHKDGVFVYGRSEQSQWDDDEEDDEDGSHDDKDDEDGRDDEDEDDEEEDGRDDEDEDDEEEDGRDDENGESHWLYDPVPPPIDTLYSWDRVLADRRLCVNQLLVQDVAGPEHRIADVRDINTDARKGLPDGYMEEMARVDTQVIPRLVVRN